MKQAGDGVSAVWHGALTLDLGLMVPRFFLSSHK